MPLVTVSGKIDSDTIHNELVQSLNEMCAETEFYPVPYDLDNLAHISNGQDNISCDSCYQILEVSIGKSRTIADMDERFQKNMSQFCRILRHHRLFPTGLGTNVFRPEEVDDSYYVHGGIYTAVNQFLKEHTSHHDPSVFFTMMVYADSY